VKLPLRAVDGCLLADADADVSSLCVRIR